MPFEPLPSPIAQSFLQSIELIATDMDGTLTTAGKFTSTLLQALEQLRQAAIPVLIVTGRSAGWVSGVVHYLPVWGAIAENGGVFYSSQAEAATLLTDLPDLSIHRQQLAAVFHRLQAKFPDLQPSTDNAFRLTDWTFDVQGLSLADLEHLATLCHQWNWGFTYSTVQCHIKPLHQEKAAGLRAVLNQHLPYVKTDKVLTIGDSPNDESLFDVRQFPYSVGVANVWDYRDQLTHQPRYVTQAAEGAGFAELVQLILSHRGC